MSEHKPEMLAFPDDGYIALKVQLAMIFRNESGTLSSTLIIAATETTYAEWLRIYGTLPAPPLRTEVDVEATSARRSKHHEPGWCYLMAGWTKVRDIPAGHGRSAKVELEAPRLAA